MAASRPAPTLAQSATAQAAFRRIQQRWLALPPGERAPLEASLQAFLDQYPTDDLARTARIYLAFILIRAGRLVEAERLVEPVRSGPKGSTRDFAQVADGGILIRRGRPQEALELLQPLRGKLIDPAERLLFGEQLVQAALECDRWTEAVDAMVEWIAEAEPEYQAGVQAAVASLIERVPLTDLERILTGLDTDATSRSEASSRAPARDWMRGAVRRYLGRVALRRHDTALAQRLVETAPATLLRDDTGLALIALGSSGHVRPRVAGRSVGLVLSVDSDAVRRRSAAVAAGMARALGLPATSRRADAVQLLMRDADDGDDAMRQALAGLAGDGAAMLVAGVDEASATAAQRFASELRIPVLLLYPPPNQLAPDGFAFSLGERTERSADTLSRQLADQGIHHLATVGVSDCARALEVAGGSRFPVSTWRKEGVDGLLLLGDSSCAREVIGACLAQRYGPRFALGLEAAPAGSWLLGRFAFLVDSAGRYPAPPGFGAGRPASGPTPRWSDWYDALGHDAGTLAGSVLRRFPLERIEDVKAVARLHRRARDELATTSAELDTTTARGFVGRRTIERELVVVTIDPKAARAP